MSEASPLNVLYIHGDGAGRFVEPHGFAVPTPNLSQLASEGVMFRNAFCTAPTCSPSRASLYCGNSPSRNGMHGLTPRGWWFRDERETLHDHLQHNGYQTVYAASPDFVQFGWDWKLIESHGGCKNEKELAAEVVEFLRHEASAAQPFFMSAGVGFPKGRERGLLPEGAAPVDRESVRPPLYYPDTPATREDWARQIDATRLMDAYVGEVLRALDESGLAENTLVLCTTDHGPGMPWMKGYPNDAGLGTFFIMRGPSGFSGGRRFDQLVSQIDFFPTVCELAGLPIPSWVEGASLLPLVRGWSEQLHEALFAETTYHYSYCPSRSVRTERYRYVRWYHQHPASMMATSDGGPIKDMLLEAEAAARPVPHEALYDRWFDPTEQRNCVDDPTYAPAADDLRQRLEAQLARVDDPIRHEGMVPLPAYAWTCDRSDVDRSRKHQRITADLWNPMLEREVRYGAPDHAPQLPDVEVVGLCAAKPA